LVAECLALNANLAIPDARIGWDWRHRLDQALIADEAMGIQAALQNPEMVFDALISSSQGRMPRVLWPIYKQVLMPRDIAGYRAGIQRMRMAAAEGLDAILQAEQVGPDGLLDGLLRPANGPTIRIMVRSDASAAVLAAAAAAQVHRQRTGVWPTAPRPDWPMDPCDGRQLRLQQEQECLKIWSVGLNRTDDGGLSGGSDIRAGDVVLELRPPR
jgi:hypothetical protein